MLIDQFGPKMKATFTPKMKDATLKKIMGYVDRNSSILLTLDLSKRFSFADTDRQVIYDACGLTQTEIEEAIVQSKQIYTANKVQANPFYASCMLLSSLLLNNKDDNTALIILTYMSLNMYTSIHKGSWKFAPDENVMRYTIAHLDNTFTIRNFPSIFAFLQDNANTAMTTYKDRIKRCTDADISWVVDAFWTRIRGKVWKIAAKFYDNHKNGRYLNDEEDSISGEDFHEMDNNAFAIDRLAHKTYTALLNRQYNKQFLKMSIVSSDTSYNKLTKLIEDIIDTPDKTPMQVISSMITFYAVQSGKPMEYIAKGDFIAFMKTAYSSNTDSEQLNTIKKIIDQWLADNMYKYGRATYGKTVQIQYRRSIFMFFVFVINYEAKV